MARRRVQARVLNQSGTAAAPRLSGMPVSPRLSGTLMAYLVRLGVRPFLVTLGILLPALLLERLLRLFNLVATENVRAGSMLRIILDLVPHYLGLALPAAMFVGIYAVIARLSADHELDAMQNAGFSLGAISVPFMAIGVVFAIGGFFLYDELQPLARYAYRADFTAATSGNWNGVVPPGEIIHLAPGTVMTADQSHPGSGRLAGVLLDQHLADGTEKITTARSGRLLVARGGGRVEIWLDDARQVTRTPDGRLDVATTPSLATSRSFEATLARFRPRGDDEREMTWGELRRMRAMPDPRIPRRRLDGEISARLVRALSMALLPVLAVPFGVTAQRSGRQSGIVAGIVVLVLYYHLIQLAQSVGTAGLLDPRPLLWGVFALFAAFCFAAFRRASRRMGDGLLDRAIDMMAGLPARLRRIRSRQQASGTP